jgi:hypothetical protein
MYVIDGTHFSGEHLDIYTRTGDVPDGPKAVMDNDIHSQFRPTKVVNYLLLHEICNRTA